MCHRKGKQAARKHGTEFHNHTKEIKNVHDYKIRIILKHSCGISYFLIVYRKPCDGKNWRIARICIYELWKPPPEIETTCKINLFRNKQIKQQFLLGTDRIQQGAPYSLICSCHANPIQSNAFAYFHIWLFSIRVTYL